MNLGNFTGRLPARTVATVVVGILFAVGFVIVFLIPDYREAARMRQERIELQAEINLQKQLVPLREKLLKADATLAKGNFLVKAEPLPLSEVGQLTARIGDMAKPAGLRVASVSPEVEAAGKRGLLAVHLRLLGPIGGMRDFLLSLARFGSLVAIEKASTKLGQDGRELTLTCWLTVR